MSGTDPIRIVRFVLNLNFELLNYRQALEGCNLPTKDLPKSSGTVGSVGGVITNPMGSYEDFGIDQDLLRKLVTN